MTNVAPQRLQPFDFRAGCTDNVGDVVQHIYYQSPPYVIYRTKKTIRLEYDESIAESDEIWKKQVQLNLLLTRVYTYLPLNLAWSEQINKQVARAISHNQTGGTDDAKLMLVDAEVRVKRLRTIQGRLQYSLRGHLGIEER